MLGNPFFSLKKLSGGKFSSKKGVIFQGKPKGETMTLANPSHCHCDKFEPSEEVLEIARNGELQRRYEKLLEAKAKEILLHEEEEQHKEVKNLRKEAALMRKRNRRKWKGVRNEEEKKKAEAQKKATGNL